MSPPISIRRGFTLSASLIPWRKSQCANCVRSSFQHTRLFRFFLKKFFYFLLLCFSCFVLQLQNLQDCHWVVAICCSRKMLSQTDIFFCDSLIFNALLTELGYTIIKYISAYIHSSICRSWLMMRCIWMFIIITKDFVLYGLRGMVFAFCGPRV